MSHPIVSCIKHASITLLALCASAAVARTPVPSFALDPVGLHRPSTAATAPWLQGILQAVHAPIPVEAPAGDGSGRQTFEVLTASGYPTDANPYPDSPYSGLMPSTYYGYSIALDGDRLFVGSMAEFAEREPQDLFGTGGVYCYRKIDGHWQLMQKLVGDDSQPEEEFGISVAVSGNTLMVGAQMATVGSNAVQGAAYVFRYDEASAMWSQTQKLVADDGGEQEAFGHVIALQGGNALIDAVLGTADGQYAVGAVYAFTESNGSWTQTGKLTPDLTGVTDIVFNGWAVALDGNTALIGAPYTNALPDGAGQGLVEAWDNSSGSWVRTQVLTPCGDPGQFPGFGWSIALHGTRAMIGSPTGGGDSTASTGVVCTYDLADGSWSESKRLFADDAFAYQAFGVSIAWQGSVVAIGSDPGVGSEVSYIFVDGTQTDSFAQSSRQGIAIDGTAIIGADPESVDIHDFPPQAAVAPSQLAFFLEPGAAGSRSLTVANAGAGSVLEFEAGNDGTKISQTASDEAKRGVGQTCIHYEGPTAAEVRPRGTGDTSWWRRFSFDELPQVGASASIRAVTVGMDSAPAGAEFTINLYSTPHDVTFDTIDDTQLTLIGTTTATASGTHVPQTMEVPVTGAIDDTAAKDLVVQYHVSAGDSLRETLPTFVPSANFSPQTHPTFLSSPTECYSIFGPHIVPYSGFGNVLMTVHLDAGAPGNLCANPVTAPWLTVPSGSGTLVAGTSGDVSVNVSTTGLADGNYSANLCVKTSDTQHALVRVPVTLFVGEGADIVFADGFDGAP